MVAAYNMKSQVQFLVNDDKMCGMNSTKLCENYWIARLWRIWILKCEIKIQGSAFLLK